MQTNADESLILLVETDLLASNFQDDYFVKMVFLPKFSLLSLSQLAISIQNKENNIKTIKNSYFDMNLQLRSFLVVVGNSRGVKLLCRK